MARSSRRQPVVKKPAKKAKQVVDVADNVDSERQRDRQRFIKALTSAIDPVWYINYYGILVPAKTPDIRSFAVQHYLDIGTRFCFSPSRSFDEVYYRATHPDVEEQVHRGGLCSGFEHFLAYGQGEMRTTQAIQDFSRWRATHPMYSEIARAVRPQFDAAWYLQAYPDAVEAIANGAQGSALMHYLTDGIRLGYSPNAEFDEAWYRVAYPDVGDAIRDGSLPGGFFHFLEAGRIEGRLPKPNVQRELEVKYPGLTRPVGLDSINHVEAKIAPLKVSYSKKGSKRLNVLVPTLDKNIMFGGYIALLNFLIVMMDRGWPIRLIVLEDRGLNQELSRLQFAKDPAVTRLLQAAEIINMTTGEDSLPITSEDRFLAYSMWMAHKAHHLAQMTGRRFLFFVQEYEPVFHAHDTWHALGASAYLKPHYAIFNSQLLRNYFKQNRYGVYAHSVAQGDENSTVFEHALAVKCAPTAASLERNSKRLLFYARPESHAARNLFEIGVVALRRAVEAKVFGREWQFEGIGTLGCKATVDLGSGRHLNLKPKLDVGDYSTALAGYDLGLSLMHAPHPSVVPFEMAACGLVVVTNVFANRDEAVLRGISGNIVPSQLSIEDLTEALRLAASKASNIKGRIAGAKRPWVRSWQESFSSSVIADVEEALR